MKLEEGMYVRTKKGEIHKLLDTEIEIRYRFDTGIDFPYLYNGNYDNQITKASHNIIDLIEVGDYVNGCKIIEKIDDTIYTESPDYIDGKIFILESEIKSIVTKEQFAQMEYKVVE